MSGVSPTAALYGHSQFSAAIARVDWEEATVLYTEIRGTFIDHGDRVLMDGAPTHISRSRVPTRCPVCVRAMYRIRCLCVLLTVAYHIRCSVSGWLS